AAAAAGEPAAWDEPAAAGWPATGPAPSAEPAAWDEPAPKEAAAAPGRREGRPGLSCSWGPSPPRPLAAPPAPAAGPVRAAAPAAPAAAPAAASPLAGAPLSSVRSVRDV